MKRVLLFLVLTAMVALVSTFTLAQTSRGRKAPRKPPKPPATEVDGGAPRAEARETRTEAQGTFQPDAGILASKTLDGGAKAYRFGEMEIEGRLKSPQIVYFLRRVRAEFAAEDLGHRPFTQELSETKKDPAF